MGKTLIIVPVRFFIFKKNNVFLCGFENPVNQ